MRDYNLRTLEAHELDAWLDFVSRVFNVPREYFKRHHDNDPYKDCRNILIAEGNGRIAATVKVFERSITVRGKSIAMGGIGEVSTDPEDRNQGLSGRLLERAIGLMVQKRMPLSLLFASLHGHYARYGWRLTPTRLCSIAACSDPGANDPRIERLPMTDDLRRSLAQAYSHLSSGFNGPVVRSDAYWETWVAGEMGNEPACILADGEPVGYVRLGDKDIMDMGLTVAQHHRLPRILGLLAQGFPGGLSVPKPLADYALGFPGASGAFRITGCHESPYQMCRIMDRALLDETGILTDVESGLPDDAVIDRLFDGSRNVYWATDGF